MIAARRCVVKKLCRASNRRNYNVHFSVVVEITKRCTPVACAQSQAGSTFATYAAKSCVPLVLDHSVSLAVLSPRDPPPLFPPPRVSAPNHFVAIFTETI